MTEPTGVNADRTSHSSRRCTSPRPIDPDEVQIPPYYPDHPITRLDWALYLETIQILDDKVGRVLSRLEDENLTEDTIVFLWGDHGRAMVRGKQFLYDEGIRIPLIVSWPGRLRPTVCDSLVSAIDLAPTWIELVGEGVPKHMQGRSIIPLPESERNHIFSARDRCDETIDRIRCVRTKRFKYIRNFFPELPYAQFNAYKKRQYPVLALMEVLNARGELSPEQARFLGPNRPEEELYDLRSDPFEIHNLADDPGHEDVLRALRGKLEDWMRRTGDQGGTPETDVVLRHWRKNARDGYVKTMRERGLDPDSAEDHLHWWEHRLEEMHGTILTR